MNTAIGARTLVLDAMGVLYQASDGVAELLVPFVRKHGHAGLSAEAIECVDDRPSNLDVRGDLMNSQHRRIRQLTDLA